MPGLIQIKNMNLKDQHLKTYAATLIMPLLIAALVVIGTFPENDWSFSIGIDPPLKWVFNWLFETGISKGQHIIFPHGPLAFLMYPLSENILLATLIYALLKTILVFGATGLLSKIKSPAKWISIAVFAYGISVFAGFVHLLLASVILLYLNYSEHRKVFLKFSAFFLTSLAFYVRAYVAIITGTIFVSLLIFELVKYRNIRQTVVDAMSMLGFMLFFHIVMYGTPFGFLHYLWGMLQLAQDNSAAAALYPYNNWLLLGISLLFIILILVINRTPKSMFFTAVFTFSIFAAWKHGMAREDYFHVKGMLIYLSILLFSFAFFERKRWPINIGLVVAVLVLLALNMQNSVNYRPTNFKLWQGQHAIEFVSHFTELKTRAHEKTAENLVSNRLSQTMLDSISEASADVYPWDYSVVAINNLNWQPRVVIQSYAAYTSWLDKQNAGHWASELAPDYIVWDKQKITVDVNKGQFNSIDYRYILNDEPQSLLQIISNYRPCCSDDNFLLLKKRKSPKQFHTKTMAETKSVWDKWIDVPTDSSRLTRCKLKFKKNGLARLKSFFYKDEQVWIYLKLSNETIHKYRIVPKNAVYGLWINPYLFDFNHSYRVVQILFKASNQRLLSSELSVEWEEITFGENSDFFPSYFEIQNTRDTLIFESTQDFEFGNIPHWSNLKDEQLSHDSFSGKQAHQLVGNKYSSTFSFSPDNSEFRDVTINTEVWIRISDYRPTSNVSLVIEAKNENGKNFYQATKVREQIIDEKGWNHVFGAMNIEHLNQKSQVIVYLYNPQMERVYIDDFRIRISKNANQ